MSSRPAHHGKWISCLYRMSQCFFERRLKPLGLGGGIYTFLLALFPEDDLSQEELRERLFFDKGTTARALSKLEDRGLVRRIPDTDDGRIKRVRLTEKGRTSEEPLRKVLQCWGKHLGEGIAVEDLEITLETLEKMGRNAAALMERERRGEGD